MKKTVFNVILFFLTINSFGQANFYLNFTPKVVGNTHVLNTLVTSNTGVKFKVTDFNYYISNLHIIYNGGIDLDLSDSVYLVKNNNFSLDLGNLSITNVENIKFGVGVPQSLNHLDISEYPENHPLSFQDPSMHWGWSAGYMHMIISGYADSNDDDVTDVSFQIHSLGDKNYREHTVNVEQVLNANSDYEINVNCNIDTWINTINLATVGVQHGEDGVNEEIMNNPVNLPVFTSDNSNLSISENKIKNGTIFYTKNNSYLQISWENVVGMNNFELVNSNGQIIKKGTSNKLSDIVSIENCKNGVYFFRCYADNKELLNQIKIIF